MVSMNYFNIKVDGHILWINSFQHPSNWYPAYIRLDTAQYATEITLVEVINRVESAV